MTAYTTYLTWSGLSHEPDELCNPHGHMISGYDEMIGLSLQTIVSCVFMFVMLICSSFRTALSADKLGEAFNILLTKTQFLLFCIILIVHSTLLTLVRAFREYSCVLFWLGMSISAVYRILYKAPRCTKVCITWRAHQMFSLIML